MSSVYVIYDFVSDMIDTDIYQYVIRLRVYIITCITCILVVLYYYYRIIMSTCINTLLTRSIT